MVLDIRRGQVQGELFVGVEDSCDSAVKFNLAVSFSVIGLGLIEQYPREGFIEPLVPVERLECIGKGVGASMSLPVFTKHESEGSGVAYFLLGAGFWFEELFDKGQSLVVSMLAGDQNSFVGALLFGCAF